MQRYNGMKHYIVKLRYRKKSKFGSIVIINNRGFFKRNFVAVLKDYR